MSDHVTKKHCYFGLSLLGRLCHTLRRFLRGHLGAYSLRTFFLYPVKIRFLQGPCGPYTGFFCLKHLRPLPR